MKFVCPVCKKAFHVSEDRLTSPIVEQVCEKCGSTLFIYKETGRVEAKEHSKRIISEPHLAPATPPGSLPSVISMASKQRSPRDYLALGVFIVALIVFVILAYLLISQTSKGFIYNPVKSVSKLLKDLESYGKGYLGDIKKEMGPHKKRKRKAKKYIYLGYNYYRKNHFSKAFSEFDRAIQIDPENPKAYFWRGRTLIKTGQYDNAIADFKMAVKFNTAYADAYDNLGWLYAREGKYDESINFLTRSIELKPDNGWAYYYRGRIYYKKGDVKRALMDTEEACRLGFQDGCKVYERIKKRAL